MDRLTARNKNNIAYLVNVKPNEQDIESSYPNTLKCIMACFERLAQYEEAELEKAKDYPLKEVKADIKKHRRFTEPHY